MTLTTLRRLVLAGNALALAASGAAAYYSLEEKPAPRDEKEWPKLFPVKKSETADFTSNTPGPKDAYTSAISWPQGDKPVEKVPEAEVRVAAPDPFQTIYRLNGVFRARGPGVPPFSTFVQLTKTGADRAFSVGVGTRIAEDPTAYPKDPAYTPWLLMEAECARTGWQGEGPDAVATVLPARAVFKNVLTGDEQTLSMTPGEFISLDNPRDDKGIEIGSAAPGGKLPPNQPFTARLVRSDPVEGIVEWEVAEEEVQWLGDYAEDQANTISALPSKDAQGNVDGIVLKSIKPGSRAAEYGFKPEDRIISVNGERVVSTADAVSKGKRQYETGRASFQIKAVRDGKELNFTFHAPPKKKGKARP